MVTDFFTFNNIKGRSGRMSKHFVGRVYLFDDAPHEELPFVDFPFYTQDSDTPESLLIQIDDDDLTKTSKDRVEKYMDEKVIPLKILRQNHSISPASQVKIAEEILENASEYSPLLAWSSYPKYEQLKFACDLIWTHFVETKAKNGVFSGRHLAFEINQLSQNNNVKLRILDELKPGKYAAKSPDEAVEGVLQFDRNWAGFDFPRFIMALSRIQEHVLETQGFPCGDYSLYATKVESCFRLPIVSVLDEYGVPMQTSEIIQRRLGTESDLDIALANLKELEINQLKLSQFEKNVLRTAQEGI